MNKKFFSAAWRVLFALVFVLSLAGISPQEARAATYSVTNLNDSGVGSLRQAILDANANTPVADTITFSNSGTITLDSSLPNITDSLTINGTGQIVTVSGNDLYPVFSVPGGDTLTLVRLTIEHGNSASSGGAISSFGTVILSYVVLAENQATNYGGAIYVSGGVLNISNSTLSNNSATTSGGAIEMNGGTGTINNSMFSGNTTPGVGGAIKSTGSGITVMDTSFSSNNATIGGGGIYADGESVTVTGSTFSGNTTAGFGGGIYNFDSTMSVGNSTFSGNSALDGGGIRSEYTLYVTNSSFSGNTAMNVGDGIYSHNAALFLINTVLANGTSGMVDCFSDIAPISSGNNLIESNDGCGTPVSSADPLLGPLASNGGPTQTFELLPGSPAIDAGDDAACAASPVDNLDQRGVPRPSGLHCDIGSYEMKQAKLIVRSDGAYDGYIWESFETSGVGLGVNATGTTFQLGDDSLDRQYRAILSFDTSALPPGIIVSRVLLKIRKQASVGTDPFTILGALRVDIRKPYFGTSLALLVSDFQAAAGRANAATFRTTPVNGWYIAVMNSLGYPYINLTGTTQFRLRFLTDDNDDGAADYMKFFSGNYATASARPTLIIDYYIP